MKMTYADFVIYGLKELPLNTPTPAEDERYKDWKDRTITITKRGPDYVCSRCGKPLSACNC